jgi:hypothetical protein
MGVRAGLAILVRPEALVLNDRGCCLHLAVLGVDGKHADVAAAVVGREDIGALVR